MRVVALVGESGSGKSYRAAWVAHEHNIEYIVDDGLLIRNSAKILAGRSAKREKNQIASVKRAIFTCKEDAEVIKKAISIANVDAILILGTSTRMVDLIARRLDLPKIDKYVLIETIATQSEIEKAKYMRHKLGKHVIPVPTFELKRDFSGYLMDPLNIFFKRGTKGPISANKTIIRPTYSYLGDYTLTKNVVASICRFEANKVPGIKTKDVRILNTPNGVCLEIDIILSYGYSLRGSAKDVQTNIKYALEEYASLMVNSIDIKIASLKF